MFYKQLFQSPQHLAAKLEEVDYISADGAAIACFLGASLYRPLYLEGEPGVGKTALAFAVARAFDLPLIRLQCYEGIDVTQAIYDWDFRRQLLFVRAGQDNDTQSSRHNALYDEQFLVARPILRAFRESPVVLLIDEIDRADDEFEAYLLEALSDFSITIPEYGTIRPKVPPLVFLTSNRTREVHEALKRRCLFHWMEHPTRDHEMAILERKLPGLQESLAQDLVSVVQRLRALELAKAPGIAETLDWGAALQALGSERLDKDALDATLGTILKYHEDQVQVRRDDYASLDLPALTR